MDRLEAFQGELAKRVLRWPKHHSNTAAITTLVLPTMRSRLAKKLGFLRRVDESDPGSLGARVLEALSDDVDALCLVRECRELEESFGLQCTDSIMEGSFVAVREMKKDIQARQAEGRGQVPREGPSDC